MTTAVCEPEAENCVNDDALFNYTRPKFERVGTVTVGPLKPVDAADCEYPTIRLEPDPAIIATLVAARDIVSRGWCRKHYQRCGWRTWFRQQYCALGAIMEAAGNDDAIVGAGRRFAAANGMESIWLYRHAIPLWNDAPNRTKAEVVAAFDRAIAWRG